MELCNHIWTRLLSQLTIHHRLIKQLHHCRFMWDNMHTLLLNHHALLTSLLLIFMQTWLWFPYVVTCILYLNLHLCTRMILWMIMSSVLPFRTLHLLWMRIKPSTELVLHNQHVLSFTKSMAGSFNIHQQKRTTPIYSYLLHSFLTSLVILPSQIFHVYLHPRMHPLLIISRTHQMLVHDLTIERTNHYLNIHLIFHLSFP